ncbi:hypothetical protein [Embleya sp. NPDC020630]|uniref:hypothetical protein n=1 Tax=Embleya sp. NPDC020630 TaxID=3363979 RepID=UPI0037BB049C
MPDDNDAFGTFLRDEHKDRDAVRKHLGDHYPALCALGPWEFMAAVSRGYFSTKLSPEGKPFCFNDHIPQVSLDAVQTARVDALLKGRPWTFRHYTSVAAGKDGKLPPPDFDVIRSHFDVYDHLVATAQQAGATPNKNTKSDDWRTLGNVKFVFTLFAVDGKPVLGKLPKMTHYAEFAPEDITDGWVSKDYMSEFYSFSPYDEVLEIFTRIGNIPAPLARGTGPDIVKATALFLLDHCKVSPDASADDIVAALDNVVRFPKGIEVKVAHTLTVKEWKEVPV